MKWIHNVIRQWQALEYGQKLIAIFGMGLALTVLAGFFNAMLYGGAFGATYFFIR